MILFNDSDLDLVCTCSTTPVLFNVEFVVLCVLICHDWALIATCGKALINDYDYDYNPSSRLRDMENGCARAHVQMQPNLTCVKLVSIEPLVTHKI